MGGVLIELDRLDEAGSTLDTGTRISEALGMRWHLTSYQMVRAVTRFTTGDWDDAIAEIEASMGLAPSSPPRFLGKVVARAAARGAAH